VLVRNNESATITIGQEVPFITNSRITDGGDTINTVTYEDIGIILGVTPHITRERLVEMEVTPEISTLTAETVPISNTVNARIIAKRSAQTRVAVADGQTVVIGGLMEDNNTTNVKKLPLLGDIPLIGALFSRTVKNKSKTELLIFLTPTVIESVAGLDKMTRDERSLLELSPRVLREPAAQRKYIAPLDADTDETQE
jgi:general secretion pathway protein D